jgi:hypothetical protein
VSKLHFRSVSSEKLDVHSLIENVNEGSYNNNLVGELLNLNDFTFFVSADNFSNISSSDYLLIRNKILNIKELAIQNSTKGSVTNEVKAKATFDQMLYEDIKTILPISNYESSQPGIWDYLTVRVLLDIAIWRFGTSNISDRVVGLNRSRHTFARWWFRRTIAEEGEVEPNYNLLETEWETLFERPSLCWNPSIANACLRVIHETKGNVSPTFKDKYHGPPNRIWIKRIMRLTSQSTLDAFEEDELYAKFWSLHPYNED